MIAKHRRLRLPIIVASAIVIFATTATWLIRRVKATAAGSRTETAAVAHDKNVDPHFARHRASLAAHAREGDDPQWARPTEAAISAQLAALSRDGHFAVVATHCRSASCIATVEWPSYLDAEAYWSALLGGHYGACGVAVTLERKAAGTGPFRSDVFFDCSRRSKSPNQQSEVTP